MEKVHKLLISFIFFFFLSSNVSLDSNLELISKFLNDFDSISLEFIQINSDGEEKSGLIKIKRPGKLRIEYNAPSDLLIVSDGLKFAVINQKLESITLYSQSQIPINPFLKNNFLISNYEILNYIERNNTIDVELTQSSNYLEGSLRLIFEKNPFNLKKWIIKSKDGSKTEMYIMNIVKNSEFSINDFKISDPRKIPFGRKD